MSYFNRIKELLNSSHSTFHVVDLLKKDLEENGFVRLDENEDFNIELGGSYFITRGGTSLIAFKIPKSGFNSYSIVCSHTDSPTFKLKPNPLIVNKYVSLDVEPYGGMISYSFFDRPLSFAGRVMIKKDNKVYSRLVDIDKNLLYIPSVAIHMNREVNSNFKVNPAVDTLPLFSLSSEINFNEFLKEYLKEDGEIISHDLYLYNRDEVKEVGINDELFCSPRIDNLTSVYSSLIALEEATPSNSIDIIACFDSEEIGSLTYQGANSPFLKDVLERIEARFGNNLTKHLSSSFSLSVDNAHALHPNHQELSSRSSEVLLNKGVVIKHSASKSYTTDALSCSLVKLLAEKANIKVQEFTNRNDMRGGSTLGKLLVSELSILSCDIGIAQLAMHSANEIAAKNDVEDMVLLLKEAFQSQIKITSDSCEVK